MPARVLRQRLPAVRGDGLHVGERAALVPQARGRRGPAARPGRGAPQGDQRLVQSRGRRGSSMMRLGTDPQIEKFRAELGRFLDEHLPSAGEATQIPTSSAHLPEWARTWQRTMYDHGWLLPMQPPEFGGRNATLPQLLAYQEELSKRRVYHSFNPQGVGIIAASIISFGTQEQQEK